jgi:polar amino acid transport system substrate-binding protein
MKLTTSKLLLIPLLALVLGLSACTSGNNAASGGETTATGPSHLEKVIKSGVVRVAVLPDVPPYSEQKPNGDFAGYEVDIAKKLAEALGVKLQLVATDGTSRLPLLQSDRVDVNISSWTATDERARTAAFTIPYVSHGASVLYRKSDPISSFDDLKNKTVSVARGSTNDTIMTESFPQAKVVRFETIADAIAALKAGKVDAAVEDYVTVRQEADKDPSLEALDAPPYKPALISMGVLQGDDVWLGFLNNFIRNINSSGTNNELYQKWFHQDIPSLGGWGIS